MKSSLKVWNRAKQILESEPVYGDWAVQLLYGTNSGFKLADQFLSRPKFSKIYGKIQDSMLSRIKISKFIAQYGIDISEFESTRYSSFNDFFVRRFKSGARPFEQDLKQLGAFAEGRYLGFNEITPELEFPVKGTDLNAAALLGSHSAARQFMGGPLLIARLCPLDYHRFHFPAQGRIIDYYKLGNKLHSVNPLALARHSRVFSENERQVTILDVPEFGKLAYVEVGALCVGKIVQTHNLDLPFKRGEEKGYFQFGASTVVLLGELGRWTPSTDILNNTNNKLETLIQLGQSVASC